MDIHVQADYSFYGGVHMDIHVQADYSFYGVVHMDIHGGGSWWRLIDRINLPCI